MDFPKTVEIAALGYQAAEARSAELLKYAMDEATYAEFRAARDRRRRQSEIVPTSIEVAGVPEASESVIRARMASHLNVPIDAVRLSRDITRLGGSDRYETIGYRIVNGPTGPILKLRVQPKPVRSAISRARHRYHQHFRDQPSTRPGLPPDRVRRARLRVGAEGRSCTWVRGSGSLVSCIARLADRGGSGRCRAESGR